MKFFEILFINDLFSFLLIFLEYILVGNKLVGVQILQKHLGTHGHETLHVGDQVKKKKKLPRFNEIYFIRFINYLMNKKKLKDDLLNSIIIFIFFV